MTPRSPDDPRIDYLFARYWDDALSSAERTELERRLTADPAARTAFNRCLAFAVSAADRPAAATRPASTAGVTRRRLLGLLGGGLAVGGAAVLTAYRQPAPPAPPPVLPVVAAWLTVVSGRVTLAPGDPRPAVAGTALYAGTMLTSHGLGSGAELRFPDGTRVGLNADTAVVLTGTAGLTLHAGTASADIAGTGPGFTLRTGEAELVAPHGATLAVGRSGQTTEIGLQTGRATVTTAEAATDLLGGELLTVRAGGDWRREQLPAGADAFAWDLSRPLDGWQVGVREITPVGPVVRPERWYDAYHSTDMYQIRSDNRWTRGCCRVWPDSRVRVRYKVDRPGQSQVVLVVRRPNGGKDGGVLEVNGAFDRTDPGVWTTFDAPAAAMLANRHAPPVGPPWVLFHSIVNTFEADLGLCVAEFSVHRPRPPRPWWGV